jgi:molybdopterin-guanine dinucleotide biosynthesis protein
MKSDHSHVVLMVPLFSEQCLGSNKPRGWDDPEAKKLKKIKNKKSLRFEDIGEDGEALENDDDFDDDESGEYDFNPADFEDERPGHKVLSEFEKERRAVLDAQLEEALEDYDDVHIGDLEEVLSDAEGEIDFEDLENNNALNQALDEYLESQKDLVLVEGTHVKKGSRNVLLLKKNEHGEYEHEELHPANEGPVDFKKESSEQVIMQQAWAEEVKELEKESKEIEKDLATCQEYLREVKIEVSCCLMMFASHFSCSFFRLLGAMGLRNHYFHIFHLGQPSDRDTRFQVQI